MSARLKLAGMIWDEAGAEAVAVVRAWLKSDRLEWFEAQGTDWWCFTTQAVLQITPAKLEHAELALVSGVNLSPLLAQDLLAKFVDPQDRDGNCKQQHIEAMGVSEAVC